MVVGDVVEHALDGLAGCVALAVVAPAAGAVGGHAGDAVGAAAAQRLAAGRVAALGVVRIKVRVGQVQHLILFFVPKQSMNRHVWSTATRVRRNLT